MDEAQKALNRTVWEHIDAKRFEQAEPALRQLIELVDPEDHELRWHLLGMLGSVCNSQEHFDEGTDAYRRSLEESRRLGASAPEVHVARYVLANQYLLFGDPRDALEVIEVIPAGIGHTQSLLHGVVAEALWKLDRRDEARVAARRAIETAPTDDRRAAASAHLDFILGTA